MTKHCAVTKLSSGSAALRASHACVAPAPPRESQKEPRLQRANANPAGLSRRVFEDFQYHQWDELNTSVAALCTGGGRRAAMSVQSFSQSEMHAAVEEDPTSATPNKEVTVPQHEQNQV
jgi:hypothetical protein